jgi:hypothetical protein
MIKLNSCPKISTYLGQRHKNSDAMYILGFLLIHNPSIKQEQLFYIPELFVSSRKNALI